jgi:hypothetical protein
MAGQDALEAHGRIAALPTSLAAALRPILPTVAEEIIAVIRAEVDEYRRPFGGDFGQRIRVGVELALGEFVGLIEDDSQPPDGSRMMRELGRGEVRAGRTVDALQAAFRCGARVAWRRFGDAAREQDVDDETLIALGEAIFAYIHSLSALSVEGWAQEQSLRAGATQRSRDLLVGLVAADPPADPEAIAAAAQRLGWEPPAEVVVAVVASVDGPGLLLRVDPTVVAAQRDDQTVALVPAAARPDDGPVVRRVREALAGHAGAVLGPRVGWSGVSRSFRHAHALLALDRAGLGPDGAWPLDAGAHLDALVVHADAAAADDLADRVLAPLDALPAGRRARHLETLGAWLDHRGHGPRMAEELHLHPQTVRYRLARLREVLGDAALDDPDGRFRLEIALRRRGERR